ncbi:MAG: hypothetical protein IPF60_20295 [Betaproteobacteria bacterium]|nr:hypothetical protein [Betaproteobacteria bacterium]
MHPRDELRPVVEPGVGQQPLAAVRIEAIRVAAGVIGREHAAVAGEREGVAVLQRHAGPQVAAGERRQRVAALAGQRDHARPVRGVGDEAVEQRGAVGTEGRGGRPQEARQRGVEAGGTRAVVGSGVFPDRGQRRRIERRVERAQPALDAPSIERCGDGGGELRRDAVRQSRGRRHRRAWVEVPAADGRLRRCRFHGVSPAAATRKRIAARLRWIR